MTPIRCLIEPLSPDLEHHLPLRIPSSVRLLELCHLLLDSNLSGASHVLRSLRQNLVHRELRRLATLDRLFAIHHFTLMRALLCVLLVELLPRMPVRSFLPLLVMVP